jgi:hypothetical protein
MADTIGILAYGSLIGNPGFEIEPHITRRIACRTTFKVEFARTSKTRTSGPTLIPYDEGLEAAAQGGFEECTFGLQRAHDVL